MLGVVAKEDRRAVVYHAVVAYIAQWQRAGSFN